MTTSLPRWRFIIHPTQQVFVSSGYSWMCLQLADLDNKLRQKRTEGGLQSSWKARQLSELEKLPKPWHTEYWTDSTLLEGSSMPFTLRPLASSKPDPLLDGKVGALQPPPSFPQLPKSVESRKPEEKSSLSPKFSFDQMVLAREKALSSKDKSLISKNHCITKDKWSV